MPVCSLVETCGITKKSSVWRSRRNCFGSEKRSSGQKNRIRGQKKGRVRKKGFRVKKKVSLLNHFYLIFYMIEFVANVMLDVIFGQKGLHSQEPVSELRVSGLGSALDVALQVATRMERDGLGEISAIRTDYVQTLATSIEKHS